MIGKKGVLLVNLGTPDSPSVSDVRRYLSQFLNDPRVIDISWLARKILVNFIIVPFRAPKSAKLYQQLWSDKGSPLLYHTEELVKKVQERLGGEYQVEMAMRYGNPSIGNGLERLRKNKVRDLTVIPLYPQYASSSNGSSVEEVLRQIASWWAIPDFRVRGQFFDHPKYIEAFVERGKQYNWKEFDHVIFSFHGLPVRQVDKVYDDGPCESHECHVEITEDNRLCYRATSYATARSIASGLGMSENDYTVSFQSRLDKNWLTPFSDVVVEERAKKGDQNLLVFSPSFVADCLETIVEIGVEYQEIFEEHGGAKVQLVESLNNHPSWVECVSDLAG
ncbi:MAG: ferrochelatase [Bacteroidia bacterium]|jgi:ferrochelatase